MPNHIYKHIEVTGSSTEGSDDAIRAAVAKAKESVHGMRWFQVQEQRGHIGEDGTVEHWQVTLKIGFRLD